VIIGINPSSDATLEEAQKFANENRVRIHSFESLVGMSENFNRSGRLARGKYLKFLCHDDILPSNCLISLVDTFEKFQGTSFAVGYESFLRSNRSFRGQESFGSTDVVRGKRVVTRILKYGNWIGGPSLGLIESSIFHQRPFDVSLECSFDLEYWAFLASIGNMAVSREIVLSSRVHPNQGTNKCINGGFQKDNRIIVRRIRHMKSVGMVNRFFAHFIREV
jgi:glycosyltransferase involved in cell wall biosynthesis